MRILMTGGTGLIGQVLIKQLLSDQDNQISVLTRSPDNATARLGSAINLITSLNQTLIDQTDIVINLAGEPIADKRWTTSQKQKICHSRWDLTGKIVELIQQSETPPHTLLSGSAVGIYGRQGNYQIDETFTQYYPEFSHEICKQWEDIALKAQSSSTRVCLLRTGIVLSTTAGALNKMLLPFKLGLGGKFASGEQVMSWIHIDDMVNAIIYLMEQKAINGAVNMTAPNAVTNQVFSETLAKQLSRPCIFTTPSFVLKLIFGEMSDLFIHGQNVVPKKLLANGFQFEYSQLNSALLDLLSD
ncbi:TIGR01777 family oxidoreductase [Thalassotalea sp. PP2-459]|uniref:TIGR01777 family oxidoreductase n=1 Tax=Thalassotalea sp. PP2-459 TaxID=1742724 RepID=UPI000944670C|nr:TIGR01777 family oxidoreductase [Thalassotalea sp. PP2-459]OKY27905.1 TIGR01777 family protein [Thalassotalea sp. PP2-459]